MQHAYNPVDWHPWGEAALNKARTENKPILVSIGYAACHWCHVMERESFEDETVAAFMNRAFINIKIDREERPDLDHIYMDAVQAMTGSGGWPLNVFLTPDLKPFFGGTYFPPKRMHNRAAWIEVLQSIAKTFDEKRADIDTQAERLTAHIMQSNGFGMTMPSTEKRNQFFALDALDTIAEKLLEQGDTVWGGFGKAPKFPQSFSIRFLLRQYHATGNTTLLNQALLSLDKMLLGGIYDQLGGGFSRYSVDEQWQVPHFEKMLYDNALLILVLAEAFQITEADQYRVAIEDTIDFLLREMYYPEGGFYSALDADSEGVEGKFYTWNINELRALLGEDAPTFCALYQVEEYGNWPEGTHETPTTNILWLNHFPTDEEKLLIERCKPKLWAAREKRVRPITDDKILLGWNALMNQALCAAYIVTGKTRYKTLAIENMVFLEEKFKANNEHWSHTYKAEKATIPAFLDDLAYLVAAYIRLQEITGDHSYLFKAKSLTAYIIDNFGEAESGFFFYTPEFQTDILLRKKEVYDGATPSGNAVMAANLQYLSIVFDQTDWAERYLNMLSALANPIAQYPSSFGVWAGVLQGYLTGIKEIVITGQQAKSNLYPVLRAFIPHKIVLCGEQEVVDLPLLMGKIYPENETLYYLCVDRVCKSPFSAVEPLLANV